MTTGTDSIAATDDSSHALCLKHFDTPAVAARYPARYGRSFRDRREQRCLLKALEHFAPGSDVLDCPCGAGRLLPLLVGRGFRVTAADSSPHMVARAEANWRAAPVGQASPLAPSLNDRHAYAVNRTSEDACATVQFDVCDVMSTGYPDSRFDGIVCNRLFHHFTEPEVRIAALAELRRISSGPIVLSFFNSFALDALKSRLKHAVRGTRPYCRSYISLGTFVDELVSAGLTVVSTIPLLRGVSPMWYVVAWPAAGKGGSVGRRGQPREFPLGRGGRSPAGVDLADGEHQVHQQLHDSSTTTAVRS